MDSFGPASSLPAAVPGAAAIAVVRAPRAGANEDTGTLVEWRQEPGGAVKLGDVLCMVETTKSVLDVEAERGGFVHPLVAAGEAVQVGQAIAVITDSVTAPSPDDLVRLGVHPDPSPVIPPTAPPPPRVGGTPEPSAAGSVRASKKAEILARRYAVPLAAIAAAAGLTSVSEADVEAYVSARAAPSDAPRQGTYENPPAHAPAAGSARGTAPVRDLVDDVYPANRIERVLIIGGGDGAVQVLDAIARTPAQRPVGIVDDRESLKGQNVLGCPVVGRLDDVLRLRDDGHFDAVVISISSNLALRARLFQELSAAGIAFANVIAPGVSLHTNVTLGRGNLIMSFVRIGSCTQVGDNNFLSAFVNLEHHNVLGSHCTFGPMVTTSGRVTIGDRVTIGAGVAVEPHLEIGSGSVIASGSVITTGVPPRTVVKARPTTVLRSIG